MYYNSSSVIYENMYKVLQTQKNMLYKQLSPRTYLKFNIFTKNGKQHTELNMTFWKTENMFCCKNML